eukprot:331053-Rhodomonas_salina.6
MLGYTGCYSYDDTDYSKAKSGMAKPAVPLFASALLPRPQFFEDEKLVDFLRSVEGLFCEDGVSRLARAQVQKSECELKECKSKAIQAQLLTEEAKKIISEQHAGDSFATFDLLWSTNEAARFVSHGRGKEDDKENLSPLGGISEDEVKAASGLNDESMPGRIHEMRSVVIPLLEQRLRAKCEALAGFCEPRAGLSFGKTFFLPDLLQKRSSEVQQREETLWKENSEQLALLCELLQVPRPTLQT